MSFVFNSEQFNRIFPFFVLINREMKIVDYGKSLRKVFPDLETEKFEDYFIAERPEDFVYSFDNFLSYKNQLLIFCSKQNKLFNFKGCLEYLNDKDLFLFIGSPWFTSIEEAATFKLNINDFAAYNNGMELLHILKTQEITNRTIEEAPVEKLYDTTMVNAIGRDNPEFVEKMIKLFLDNISRDINSLNEAAEKQDTKGINFYAHKMKSSIESMGITALKSHIKALEMKEKIIEDESIINEHVSKLNTYLQKVIHQMKSDFPNVN